MTGKARPADRGGQRPGMRGGKVSVKDVAASAGVSLGTVSNVLNRPELVSAATRAKVEEAMAVLGFVRNESARQLRSGKSRVVAYLMLDAGNPFFSDVAEGIEGPAAAAGLSVFRCASKENPEREAQYLELLEELRVQGVLVTPVDPDTPRLSQLPARGTPLVVVDRTVDERTLCSVAVDDVLGGDIAVTHLVELGHKRIAYVGGPASLGQVGDRLAGARVAAARAGLPEDALTEVQTAALSITEGRVAAQRLVGLPARRRPTAAFCANDLLALGLLQQCMGMGLMVPRDLAIVGYDDIDFASAAVVPLSSVRQPRLQLGRTAIELLLDEASNPDHTHKRVQFTPELIVRSSTHGIEPASSAPQAAAVPRG